MEKTQMLEEKHAIKMLEGLNRLRLNSTLCDVIICCGGKQFRCHRNVLASFSSYFEAMFTNGMLESRQEEVNMSDVEPQVMKMLVSYAYTSKLLISMGNVQALLAAANLLGVTAVEEACCQYMERHMGDKNCVGIHLFAEAHSCKGLEKRSMDYILENFSVVYQQEEFLALSVDKLTDILASDDLHVCEEEVVFEAAMLWLNKCPTRRQNFEKVLEHIRLSLISTSYLHDVIESLDVVKESQACQKLIYQYLLPYCHRAPPRRFTVLREEILLFGDRYHDGKYISSVESFDPVTNRWKTLASLPFSYPSSEHHLVVLGTLVYLAVAHSPERSVRCDETDMWLYDSSRDSWLKMASMNEARCGFGLVMLDSYVYAVGGYNGIHDDPDGGWLYVRSVERYDPSNDTWQLVESVNAPRFSCVSVVALDGLIYAIDYHRMLKYNPKTSVWTEGAPVLDPRFGSAACTLKGKIYVAGGAAGGPANYVKCYDPETDQWSMCACTNKPHIKPQVAVVDAKLYVLGGLQWMAEMNRMQGSIERYDEETASWEVVGEMPTAFSSFSCVSLRMKDKTDSEAHAQGEPTHPETTSSSRRGPTDST